MSKGVDLMWIRRRGMPTLFAVAFMSSVLSACAPVVDTAAAPAQSDISPIEAIKSMGQVGLPAWPEILGAESDSGADTRYRMVMRLDGGQLEEFLSQFLVAPQPSEVPRSMSVIAGPALGSAPDLRFLQTGLSSSDGAYIREIIVDTRAPDETYVHISVYTT